MYIHQADLLQGMNRDFLKEFISISTKESWEKGHIIFREGDHADYFYVLLNGHVKLSIGDTGHVVHVIDHPGKAFGWSSLVGRDFYSASAECRVPTKIRKIEIEGLQKIFENDPVNGLVFFKRLAATLGHRLLQTYKLISSSSQPEIATSYGTGQVIESAASSN